MEQGKASRLQSEAVMPSAVGYDHCYGYHIVALVIRLSGGLSLVAGLSLKRQLAQVARLHLSQLVLDRIYRVSLPLAVAIIKHHS